MGGRGCTETSWDAQAFLESAMNLKQEGVVALLDYYKFFDSFDPSFYGPLMRDVGIDEKWVNLSTDINVKATRRMKIGDTFGASFKPYNALGQGDTATLMVAPRPS